MKRLIVLALAAILTTGCATTGFLGFLATTKYVDRKVQAEAAEASSALEQTRADLEQTRGKVEDMEQLAGKMEGMLNEVSQVQKSTEELGKLVHELELKMSQLPDQTLRLLSELIQTHLSSSPKPPAE